MKSTFNLIQSSIKLLNSPVLKTHDMLCMPSIKNRYNNIFLRSIYLSASLNAGHAKWQNIQHIKSAKDKEKSVIFNQFHKRIVLATQGN